jgi:hypothetical protein
MLNTMDTASVDSYPTAVACIGPYTHTNLVSDSNSVTTFITAGITGMTMPKAGSIVGVTADRSGTLTNGTWGLKVVKNGTNLGAGSFTISALAAALLTKTAFVTNLTSYTFSAGDRLGVFVTTSATAAMTETTDATFTLWVT